jgi:hypothetical protein
VGTVSVGLILCVAIGSVVIDRTSGDGHRGARPVGSTSPGGVDQAVAPSNGFVTSTVGTGDPRVTMWSWDGVPVRTVPEEVGECCVGAGLSPDGKYASVYRGNEFEVIDLDGNVAARRAPGSRWAEDSKHLCDVRPHDPQRSFDTPADLVYSDLGRNLRVVRDVGRYGPHLHSEVMWCSVSQDKAIVADAFMGGRLTSVHAVRLSTRVVSNAAWASTGTSLIAVSGDGSTALLRDKVRTRMALVDTASGVTKAYIDGSPLAISWRGRVVVGHRDNKIVAIDSRTRKLLWQSEPSSNACPCTQTNALVAARANSDDLALVVNGQRNRPWDQAELWLVSSYREARLLRYPVAAGRV